MVCCMVFIASLMVVKTFQTIDDKFFVLRYLFGSNKYWQAFRDSKNQRCNFPVASGFRENPPYPLTFPSIP